MQTMAISCSSSISFTITKSLGGMLSLRYCQSLSSANASSVTEEVDNPISLRVLMEVAFTQRLRWRGLSILCVPCLTVDTYTSPYSPFGVIGEVTMHNHLAYGF